MGTDKLLEFKGEDKTYPDDAWVAAPVKSDDGSLVLIHGQVMQHRKYILNTLILKTNLQVYHKTERNTRDKPRPAYTFHIIETEGSHYASKNWLQPTAVIVLLALFYRL